MFLQPESKPNSRQRRDAGILPDPNTHVEDDIRPLPEDFPLREQVYTEGHHPENLFTDTMIDDDERSSEFLSMTEAREEWMLWLNRRIASDPITIAMASGDHFNERTHRWRHVTSAETCRKARGIGQAISTHELGLRPLLNVRTAALSVAFRKTETFLKTNLSRVFALSARTQGIMLFTICLRLPMTATARSIPNFRALPDTEPQSNIPTLVSNDLRYLLASAPYIVFVIIVLSAGHILASIKEPSTTWVTFMTIWSLGWAIIKSDTSTTLALSARFVSFPILQHLLLTLRTVSPRFGAIRRSNMDERCCEICRYQTGPGPRSL